MTKEELLVYELPSVAEYISNPFLQELVARYTARKVNQKVKRWNKRQDRVTFLKLFAPTLSDSK